MSHPSQSVGDGGSESTYRGRGRHELGFPREATALLVIDPVNDFLGGRRGVGDDEADGEKERGGGESEAGDRGGAVARTAD